MINRLISFCLRNGIVVAVLVLAIVLVGVAVMPFRTPFDSSSSFRNPVPVDAIPDISENQVIVATEWAGRSPEDVEDQVTYPLTTSLQGVPNVVNIRAISGFGFSRIYVIFEDGTDFYWARTRVLERLATTNSGLPQGVTPALGPDATALGQIFWYTVEGPGKSLDELRALQDFQIKYALQAVPGVSEVASAGGQVREYQVNVNPEHLRALGITMPQVADALRNSNLDIGARTHDTDDGGMELLIRGVGFVESLDDVRDAVITTVDHRPIYVRDVAEVSFGPAFRRGALVDDRIERVGGVVVMRFGANPRLVIEDVKREIEQLNNTLAQRNIRIVPFYDRTELIAETLDTLTSALTQELLITIVVVIIFLLHLRTGLIVASALPLAVLIAFALMKISGVDSNIMSLGGIAIAVGVMVDMAIIVAENAYNHLLDDAEKSPPVIVVERAAHEVSGAIITSVLTIMFSFLPVIFLTGMEGRMFRPLVITNLFVMGAAAMLAVVPLLCRLWLPSRGADGSLPVWKRRIRLVGRLALALLVGLVTRDAVAAYSGGVTFGASLWGVVAGAGIWLIVWRLSGETLTPIDRSPVSRFIHWLYAPAIRWVLRHKLLFLTLPATIILVGFSLWLGGRTLMAPLLAPMEAAGADVDRIRFVQAIDQALPGIGREFMPPLDEGSLLYMPSFLPTASMSQVIEGTRLQNQAMYTVPEVESVMAKVGRAESALDPAPIGMVETYVSLKPRSEWRPGVTVDTILEDLKRVTSQPGVNPSWLQPIETRVVMLQSGIRASIAMKVYGDNPTTLEAFCAEAEHIIRAVPGAADVTTQRISGKLYLEFHLDRKRLAHYGIKLQTAQHVIQVALGGMPVTTTVEGRERFAVRARYPRERRGSVDDLGRLLLPTPSGAHIPISYVADIRYRPGPAAILTEDLFVYSYVSFNARGRDEVGVVQDCQRAIAAAIAAGTLVPPEGMARYEFGGRYEYQQRANSRLAILIPTALLINLFLVFLHFRKLSFSLLVFSGIPLAFAGGFIFISLWPGCEQIIYWLDHNLLWGTYPMPRGAPVYLTVAVWVGVIALFGIAIEDGVVITTYISQLIRKRRPTTVEALRGVIAEAGLRRIRPCLMTTFTTMFALAPVLWATGRGSDVMKPMAMPIFGGMMFELITLFIVPCIFGLVLERRLRRGLPVVDEDEAVAPSGSNA